MSRTVLFFSMLAAAFAECPFEEVNLLQARQDQLSHEGAAQESRQLKAVINTSHQKVSLPPAPPGMNATGPKSAHSKMSSLTHGKKEKHDGILLELTSSVVSRLGSYTGGLFMVMAFTFFAFLCSCTAILVTRAFLQEQYHGGQLADHERRQRLLQSLASRAPKKEVPGTKPTLPGVPGGPTPGPTPLATGLPPLPNSPWRRVVIDKPLEGDRLGVNLTEDTLVIIDFTDPRAARLGFKVGERIVHVNGVPVFQQADFQKVLMAAFRENHQMGTPIVLSTVDPTSSYPNNLDLSPEMEDICGRWQLSNGEIFVISRLPGLQYLLMTMMVGGQPTASGLVMMQSAEELRCQLFRTDGSSCGDVLMNYSKNAMDVRFSAAPGTWGQPLEARRASAPTVSLPASSPESLPPRTLP